MSIEYERWVLEASPDAMIVTDREGVILFWNNGAENMFGYPRAEALGQNLQSLVVPPHLVEEEAQAAQEIGQTGNRTYEAVRRAKDGSLINVAVTAKTVLDDQQTLRCILWSKKDVSELKVNRDEKLLAGRFGHVLESMPDAIVIVNSTGRIILANSQAERLFGYAPREFVGKLVEVLIPGRYRQPHLSHRTGYIARPHTRPMGTGYELYGLRKDQTEFPVEISLSPIRTEEGTLFMSAIRDISERKQFERQLQEKNRLLESANDELEAFSYSISHDLRAPARAMDGFVRIISKKCPGQLPPEAEHALQRISANARQMGHLIDGLLSFSRLTRQALVKTKVLPGAVVRAVFEELRPEEEGRPVELELSDLPACEADPTLLRQVFVNLLSNALKYSRGRNPARIEVGASQDGGETVYFVRDNGVGFEMEYASKLFKVFQRLHSRQEFDGTGVGLAIVHRIIQRHGGRIWAESAAGQGACFSFTLGR